MKHGSTFFSAVVGAPWEDVAPLARVLEVTLSPECDTLTPAHAQALWKELSYLGSNDLAYLLRGFEGVDYPEVVRDVGKQLKVVGLQPGEAERVVELNEQLVLARIFADSWEPLDADQRRQLLRELNLDDGHLPLAGAAVAAAVLDGRAGPFAIYKLSRIVARSAAGALLEPGLTRARRKAAQAVVLVASLRQAQRTALAETALASAEAPSEPPAEPSAQPRKRKSAVREQTPARLASPGPRKKTQRKQRLRKKKTAQPPRAVPKRRTKKITAKKKVTAKKAIGKSKSAKKRGRTPKRG